MCGIGVVFGRRLRDGGAIMKKSLGAITHRGSSLFETASFPDCCLGANRLEIVDAKGGRQPVANEDGTVLVVFNGEIFNHRSLRAGLEGRGHRFATRSDTEVLVHLYEEHGAGMAGMLDSEMFSFVIYDRRAGGIFAARDPYGVKPLYYAEDADGNMHFASEIKQLAQFDGISEIREFPPGHYMEGWKLERYHRIPEPAEASSEDAATVIANLRHLFDEAVRKRVDTDLPVAVLFSGGLDSAAVLATALKFNTNVTALTVADAGSPDRKTAIRYCREAGIRHIVGEPLGDAEVARRTDEFIRTAETYEPRLISHLAAYEGISSLAARSGFRIVLCGEGADELFGGYASYELASYGGRLPQFFRSMAGNIHLTQFQRLDRSTMSHTVEARAPFFDTAFADYALRIPAGLKVRPGKGDGGMKWIFRQAMKDRLPEYITQRKKLPLHRRSDAIYGGDLGGYLYRLQQNRLDEGDAAHLREKYPGWQINDGVEAYAFRVFADCGYAKALFNRKRAYSFIPKPGIIERIRFWPKRMVRNRLDALLGR